MLMRLLAALLLIFIGIGEAIASATPIGISGVNISASLDNAKQQLQWESKRLQWMKEALTQLNRNNARELKRYLLNGVTQNDLLHASLDIASTKATLGNIKIALTDAHEAYQFTQSAIDEIRRSDLSKSFARGEIRTQQVATQTRRRESLERLIAVQQKRIGILKQLENIVERRQATLMHWQMSLQKLYDEQLAQTRQEAFVHTAAQLQNQQRKLLGQLTHLTQQTSNPHSTLISENQPDLQFRVFATQEKISQNRIALFLVQLRNRIGSTIDTEPLDLNVSQLRENRDKMSSIQTELQNMQKITHDKIQLVQEHDQFLKNNLKYGLLTVNTYNKYHRQLKSAVAIYQQQIDQTQLLFRQLSAYNDALDRALKKQFAVRQELPGLDLAAWKSLGRSVLAMPVMLWRSIQAVAVRVYYQVKVLSTWDLYFFILVGMTLLLSWIFLRKSFMQLLQKLEESSKRFTNQVLSVFITVVRRNLGTLFVISGLLGLLVFLQIDISLWMSFALAFLGYRAAVILAKLWLLESETDAQGKDVRLYHGLKWIFAAASVLTVLMLLTYNLPVTDDVRVLFNKLFMLLLLLLSLILLRAWSVLPMLIKRAFNVRRIYIMRVIHLACWVLPITMLSNAVIGLIGYIDLAWTMSRYQAIALLILTGYMVVRGLLIDLMEFNYDLVISRVRSGWLWAQALVRPTDRILRITLFLMMIWLLLHYCNLDNNGAFLEYVSHISNMSLFTLLDNPISLKIFIEFLVFISVLYWAAKWSREFAFRWLFMRTRDIGVRNSLSVFTQYLLVIIGVVVGLRLFGVELKGLTVVAAAFAAAAGFGMRDILANIFSGFVLLAERPFRTGDTITLGQYEGEVISTGIRSMKIRTWDRMDVIVPNMDILTKPFVNWTHRDTIVRCVLKLNIHRDDDPHLVQQLILKILDKHPSLVESPAPEVLLKEMSEVFLELEVRFFINLQIENSRPRVRSEVLFAIWDAFKKHNIRSPYPQYNVSLVDRHQAGSYSDAVVSRSNLDSIS